MAFRGDTAPERANSLLEKSNCRVHDTEYLSFALSADVTVFSAANLVALPGHRRELQAALLFERTGPYVHRS
jgi:hypothetical protein